MTDPARALAAAAAAAAAVLFAAPSASAAFYTVTFSGVLAQGEDVTGLFGAPGTDLAGAAYVATFHYRTDRGARLTVPGVSDLIYGGSDFGLAKPLGGEITIDGVTEQTCANQKSEAEADPGEVTYDATADLQAPTRTVDRSILAAASVPGQPASLDAVLAPQPAATVVSFEFYDARPGTGEVAIWAHGSADVPDPAARVAIAVSVPEPGAWTLMLGGLGLAGAALRGRARDQGRGRR